MSDARVTFDITGNTDGITRALDDTTNAVSRSGSKWAAIGKSAIDTIGKAGKVAFSFAKDLAINSFKYNASMEQYLVNFKTMLGSQEAAQKKLNELREYASKTPFSLDDLAGATQTLLAFGISSETSAEALKMLGDISLGDSNKLSSLTLAFAQMTSTGKLMGQDLLQMINAGFNPLAIIAEKTGASIGDLKEIMAGKKASEEFNLLVKLANDEVEKLGESASDSAKMLAAIGAEGQISADIVLQAMRIATSAGGIFHNALLNASTTATGQISTIKDKWNMLVGSIGYGGFEYLSKTLFPKTIDWLDRIQKAYDSGGLKGIQKQIPSILKEVALEVLDVAAIITAAIYNAITGKNITKDDIKVKILEVLDAVAQFFADVWEFVKTIKAIIDTIAIKLGIKMSPEQKEHIANVVDTAKKDESEKNPRKLWGKYAGYEEDVRYVLWEYAQAALKKGNLISPTDALYEDELALIPPGVLEQLQADLNSVFENLTAEDIDAMFEDAQGDLQSQLDATNLSAGVTPVLGGMKLSGLVTKWLLGGAETGKDHATGGVFTSATRMMGEDGMHTFGESGTEVLLPLDTLWRKMGMMIDQGFSEKLAGLQYNVLPQPPAPSPAQPVDESLPDKVAKAVREAMADLTIEMDRRTVGRMVAPVVSQEMADDMIGRRWTS